jgi:CTP:molybdopterin cytidylyltransferase MocA
MGFLPADRVKDGLKCEIEILGERRPATVHLAPLWDGDGAPTVILRGGTDLGQPGHPAIFPHDLWPALTAVIGDEGGRSVIHANHGRVRVMPLPGLMALLDLDTPEDWAAWRA